MKKELIDFILENKEAFKGFSLIQTADFERKLMAEVMLYQAKLLKEMK